MGDEAPELSIPIHGFFYNSASTVGTLPPNVDPETPIVLSASVMAILFGAILERWALSKADAQRTWVEPPVDLGEGPYDSDDELAEDEGEHGTSIFLPPNNFMLNHGLQANRRRVPTFQSSLQWEVRQIGKVESRLLFS